MDLRPVENPSFAQPIEHKTSEDLRHSMMEADERLLDQTGAKVLATVSAFKGFHRIGKLARAVLQTARSAGCDLVAGGSQGLGRVAELFLGGVSHKVLHHVACPVLIVR